MRGFVLAAVIAGCAGDQVVVEVDTGGLDVATVELVLSNRVCQDPERDGDCTSVQGEGFVVRSGSPGDLYLRDAAAISGDIDRGKVAFELPSGGDLIGRAGIAMAFAIGRDANNSIVGAAVMAQTLDPSTGPIRYRVTLEPTDDLRSSRMPGIAAAAQWGDRNQCLGVEPTGSTLDIQRPVFILPEDDLDCDGRHQDDECDPLWFDGISFDESIAAHCVQPRDQDLSDPNAPCLLGHVPTCIENPASPNNRCLQSPICLPSALCSGCRPDQETCQQARLESKTADVRIECEPPGNNNAAATTSECDGGNSEFGILPLSTSLAGATCTNVQLVETPAAAFHSPRGDRFTSGMATFEIDRFDADCTVHLKWNGSFVTGEIAHTVLTFTIDVAGQTRELWVPINFHVGVIGCGSPTPACKYTDGNPPDTILQCALP